MAGKRQMDAALLRGWTHASGRKKQRHIAKASLWSPPCGHRAFPGKTPDLTTLVNLVPTRTLPYYAVRVGIAKLAKAGHLSVAAQAEWATRLCAYEKEDAETCTGCTNLRAELATVYFMQCSKLRAEISTVTVHCHCECSKH